MRSPRSFLGPLLVVSLLLAPALQATASAAPAPLMARLSGDAGGDPDGAGVAGILLTPRKGQVCWAIAVSGIELPATAAHIHSGRAGQTGGIVVFLSAPDADGIASGCTDGIHPTILRHIKRRPHKYYVNVHNSEFPSGALRGQLAPVQAAVG